MFTKLMDNLYHIYSGEVIYLPDKLKPFLEPWLKQQAGIPLGHPGLSKLTGRSGFQSGATKPESDGLEYRGKKVLFFCEDSLVKSYKATPLPYTPEKIAEEDYVIEFSLEVVETKRANKDSSKDWWKKRQATKVTPKKKEVKRTW